MTKEDRILKSKLGLLNLVKELGNISKACELMGYSRDSYYRLKKLYEKGGVLALQEKTRKQPNLKNRVDETVEKAAVKIAFQEPFHGQSKAAKELRKQGISVSAAGVRSIWKRYDLENFNKRLKALATKVLQESHHPTDQQLMALEQAKKGYKRSDSKDTFYPGHLMIHSVEALAKHKELGTLYQFVLLDTYTRMAFVYLSNNASTNNAVESISRKLLPFFQKEDITIRRILTTKEPSFVGKHNNHLYQRFAKQNHIELDTLSRSSSWKKALNKFLQLINNDFFSEAFRTKRYNSTAALQADLDNWVANYNNSQPIHECYNYGKTPMATYKAILPFTKYLKNGKHKSFPNGIHPYLELLQPLVIPNED